MPGPMPKPDSERVRRNAVVQMTVLPAFTREPAPTWPLPEIRVPDDANADALARADGVAEREHDLWLEHWTKPQATLWHRQQNHFVVARYIRYLVAAELGDIKAAAECRHLERVLLLTPDSMVRARVTVAEDELAVARAAAPAAAPETTTGAKRRTSTSRRRLASDGAAASR